MLRFLLCLGLAALVLSADASAQSYEAYRLDVHLVSKTRYQSGTSILGTPTRRAIGSELRWEGSIGGRRVSEDAFYRHAGLDELADRIAADRRRGRTLVYGGSALALGGIVVGALGLRDENDDNEYDSPALLGVGAAATGVGAVLAIRGGRIAGRQHTSADRAREVALRYNRSLERSRR